MAGITSDLAKKSRDPPRRVSGGSPDDFRRDNIAGPHGIFQILNRYFFTNENGVLQRYWKHKLTTFFFKPSLRVVTATFLWWLLGKYLSLLEKFLNNSFLLFVKSFLWALNSSSNFSNLRISSLALFRIWTQSVTFKVCKGQLISEWIFDALNFPKKQCKNLMNFCPRI
jgi:hypothetical protein